MPPEIKASGSKARRTGRSTPPGEGRRPICARRVGRRREEARHVHGGQRLHRRADAAAGLVHAGHHRPAPGVHTSRTGPMLRQRDHEQMVGRTESVTVTTGAGGDGIDVTPACSAARTSTSSRSLQDAGEEGFQWQLLGQGQRSGREYLETGEGDRSERARAWKEPARHQPRNRTPGKSALSSSAATSNATIGRRQLHHRGGTRPCSAKC